MAILKEMTPFERYAILNLGAHWTTHKLRPGWASTRTQRFVEVTSRYERRLNTAGLRLQAILQDAALVRS